MFANWFVCWLGGGGELCLQIGLSVRWLGVMFAIGFVCWLVAM